MASHNLRTNDKASSAETIEIQRLRKELQCLAETLKPIGSKEFAQKIRSHKSIAIRKRNSQKRSSNNKQKTLGEKDSQKTAWEPLFLSRLISYLGEEEAVSDTGIEKKVKGFVQKVLKIVAFKDPRFKGELVKCGSYYEGVKVKEANEFDYIWELDSDSISADNLVFKNVTPETFKPRKNDDVYARTYFKMYFGNVPSKWKCKDCRKNRSRNCSHRGELVARDTQLEFHKMLEDVVSSFVDEEKTALVTMNGPAVTLYTELNTDDDIKNKSLSGSLKGLRENVSPSRHFIKIDITLAIAIVKSDPNIPWPFQKVTDIEFEAPVGPKCHLVTAGDFWKLSFSTLERDLIKELTKNKHKRHCFQAIKVLRDELSLTTEHESALLSTYPLKITFLKENKEFCRDYDWDEKKIPERTRNILKLVEEDGEKGTLTSYFVENDPVMLESDRSYLESRRIRLHLQKMGYMYRVNGYVHMAILIVYMLCHFSIITVSIINDMADCASTKPTPSPSSTTTLPGRNNNGHTMAFIDYVFAVLPLSFVAFSFSLVGLLYIIIQMFGLQTKSVLYSMFRGPMYVYSAFVVIGIIESVTTIQLAVKVDVDECQKSDVIVDIYVICGTSSLPLIYMLFHLIVFMTYTKYPEKIRYYSWEFIFFDGIYKETFAFLPCCAKRTEKPPPVEIDYTNPSYGDYEDPDTVTVVTTKREVNKWDKTSTQHPTDAYSADIADDEIIYEDTEESTSSERFHQQLERRLREEDNADNYSNTEMHVENPSSNSSHPDPPRESSKHNETQAKPKIAPKPRPRGPPLPPRRTKVTTFENQLYSLA